MWFSVNEWTDMSHSKAKQHPYGVKLPQVIHSLQLWGSLSHTNIQMIVIVIFNNVEKNNKCMVYYELLTNIRIQNNSCEQI